MVAKVINLFTPYHPTTPRDIFRQGKMVVDLERLGAVGHTSEVQLDQAVEWQ